MKVLEEIRKMEKLPKENKSFRSIETLFRNSLRSNLELTSLADSKASVLISVNGFILTVIITASGLYLNNPTMVYPFIVIMLTALISILLGTMAIRPRDKVHLTPKEHLDNFKSVAYFQDMADVAPEEYLHMVQAILKDKQQVHEHIIKHIHILGSEIKLKYYWLKLAYTAFGIGLSLSAILMIFALFENMEPQQNIAQFKTIYEPSGAVALPNNQVLLVEDESQEPLHLIEVNQEGEVKELGSPKMSRKTEMKLKHKVRDLEGVTSHKNQIYAITSHTTNKAHKHKKAREQIIRFKYQNGKVSHLKRYHGLLDELKKLHPAFKTLSKKRKKEINVEALAWNKKSNSLLIGFRAPLIKGKAVVVALTNPDAIFDKKEQPKLKKPLQLDLYGDGIRGMSWDEAKQGYWIISGSVGKRKGEEFALWFWDKKNNTLTIDEENRNLGYAEGVTKIKNLGLFIVQDNGSRTTHGANYALIKE